MSLSIEKRTNKMCDKIKEDREFELELARDYLKACDVAGVVGWILFLIIVTGWIIVSV